MRRGLFLILLLTLGYTGFSQVRWTAKAGGGPSWMAFPNVYMQDPTDTYNTLRISPAATGGTFYVGAELLIPMGEHWGFRSELNFSYVSGEVNVDVLIVKLQSRKLQSYTRLNIPLLFSVKSSDNFWASFGPVFFFNLHDNKGFEDAFVDFGLDPTEYFDTDIPWGVQSRLAIDIKLNNHLFLELKFDYDIGKYFKYEDDIYKVRLASQGVTAGLTYLF